MREAVIVDLDDTLALTTRARLATGETYFRTILSGNIIPNATVENIVHELIENNIAVIALTARPAVLESATRQWLIDNGFENIELVITDNPKRRPDHVVKEELLSTIDAKIIHAFDDRQDNIDMFNRHGIPTTLIGE